ncbi:uncharacterized protein PV09_08206 [Verruconis gallopava]|uniref:Major facilitator superfamily (MFS) profile domain-containing protein n=1 Tax=Verruconis gallopava TaxID=253628 RepID=A0A0D2AMF8_9PEZI|nr:uncharacterized protein PV09_08206 [Verruconis gallopava]KIW00319.1 hypothetical protein PV09_08206 [Verruconis gallopava]
MSCQEPSDSEKALPPPSSSTASSISDIEEHSPGYDAPTLQKCLVVFVTSFVTLTGCFSSTSLMSAATQIADEFHSTPDVVNASNAGLLMTMGLSNFIWGPLIPLIGRLYAWNSCILLLLVWTAAASVAPNLPSFIVFRVLSGFQGTFFHVTGQAILAEFFPPVKRGTATGFFLSGTVLGPPLGPLVAGIITQYTSWRVILYLQCGMITLGLCLSLLLLGRGGKPAKMQNPSIRDIVRAYNPMRIIRLLRYPNLLLTDFAAGLLAFSQYGLLASPRHIFLSEYHLESPLTSGLFFLSPATGLLLGTLIGGRFSDRTVRKWIQRRNGLRLPQDRLRSGFPSWFILIPIAYLMFGWGVQYQIGGLAWPIVTAFFTSVGILSAFAGVNTYCAEVFPNSRQEAIATKYVIQYVFSALASGVSIPLIDGVGVGMACTISVIFVYIGGSLCAVTAIYGITMQNWVDSKWPKRDTLTEKRNDNCDGVALAHVISAP